MKEIATGKKIWGRSYELPYAIANELKKIVKRKKGLACWAGLVDVEDTSELNRWFRITISK